MALVLKAKVFLNTVGSNPTPPEITIYIIHLGCGKIGTLHKYANRDKT